ncbi:3537_t:CDS:1, partial [Cetraspora pellucida]
AYDSLISYLQEFKLDNSSASTNSDYQILTSTWTFPFAMTKVKHKSKSKR